MKRWIASLCSLLAAALASAEQTADVAQSLVTAPAVDPSLSPSSVAILLIGIAGIIRLKQANKI